MKQKIIVLFMMIAAAALFGCAQRMVSLPRRERQTFMRKLIV